MEKKKITLGSVLVNLDAIITCVTLTLCTIVVNVNVLMRYFLKRPLYWSEEVAYGALRLDCHFIGMQLLRT